MYEYRQVIHRIRMGESDRTIAKSKLIGRAKCAAIRSIAEENGWLSSRPLPSDSDLERVFKVKEKGGALRALSATPTRRKSTNGFKKASRPQPFTRLWRINSILPAATLPYVAWRNN